MLNRIGYMYSEGLGVAENGTEAVKWFRKAAEQGYSIAYYNMGLMYELGNGVTKDMGEAVGGIGKRRMKGMNRQKRN